MKTINSIEEVNQLSENDFISTFGNVFEKTNWIANKAFSLKPCLLYTSPSPRDTEVSRMPSSA